MPETISFGRGRTALTTLLVGARLTHLFRKSSFLSWKIYCERFGFDLVIFDTPLDDTLRGIHRSPAWQKCLVADSNALKKYATVCWIDADVIINHRMAPSIFDHVPIGTVGAVEAWASPTVEVYKNFLSSFGEHTSAGIGDNIDYDAATYYSRYGLSTEYPTVVQTGVMVFDPNAHGHVFRDVYDRYEDRGPAWWHYEMRPLSYELHRSAAIAWLDPRFNYNAICDVVAIQREDWPSHFSLLDKVAIRLPWTPFLRRCYRRKISSISATLDRAWFLHFSGFRFGLLLASVETS
jgi:hypothetical protein